MGFNGGVVFNDSLLLDVAKPRDYDRVSAFGYALGYLGGGAAVPRERGDGDEARAVRPGRCARRRCACPS